MVFSSTLLLIKLVILNYDLYIVTILINNNICNVYVLYKIIYSKKFNLLWTRTLFLYIIHFFNKTSYLDEEVNCT
jgi:hypothetical protein